MEQEEVRVYTTVPEDVAKQLSKMAKANFMSRSGLLRKLICEAVERKEKSD